MRDTPLPVVARVLLVAHRCRQDELAGWLTVDGEPVRYELRACAPEELPDELSCDVLVIDGESLPDEPARFALLRRAGHGPRDASVVYVCSRLSSEDEIDLARIWADDFVYSGWAQAERVRRRVQLVALAPWRRSRGLRRHAEALGNDRLRVLPSRPRSAEHRSGRHGVMTREQARLASETFGEERRVAVMDLAERVNGLCKELLEEVEQGRHCPEASASIEGTYRGVRSPAVVARFDGAAAAVEAVWGTLRQLLREELAVIESSADGGGGDVGRGR